MKKSLIFAVGFACTGTVFGMSAPAPKGITILVVPARYSVLQIAFDAADRMGAVLVSYQASRLSSLPVLDYWADREWQRISISDYQSGNFVRGRVSQVILVGTDEMIPQNLVTASASLSGNMQRVSSLDTPGLINKLGKIFSFSPSDWQWFAIRYNLQLNDRNAARRTHSWYDRASYSDEWSERWRWLRRRHNSPHAAIENGASFEMRTDELSASAAAESTPLQSIPEPEKISAAPIATDDETQESSEAELTAPIERFDMPLIEPAGTEPSSPSVSEPNASDESEEEHGPDSYPVK